MASSEEYHRKTWRLQSFAVEKNAKSVSPGQLMLDRANAEFGIIRNTHQGVHVVVRFPDTNEPVYFAAKDVRAAAWREKCKKVSVLLQYIQVDLEFRLHDCARSFLDGLEDLTLAVGNHFFYSYEVPKNEAFMRADFDMVKMGYTNRDAQPWASFPAVTSEWPRLRKTGEWSDFTVIAEGTKFPVHRVKICKESLFFQAACTGGFAEAVMQSIELPESASTVESLLDEMYDLYNPVTSSLFTGFVATRLDMEKERNMNQLLALFIAADKYNLEKIKRKAAEAMIDRLPFIQDPLIIVDLACSVYSDDCPQNDRGLRRAVVACMQARMPCILQDQDAWQEFSNNKAVLKAFHRYQCEVAQFDSSDGTVTPPATPTKK
ncbi:hypothetical protein ACN47E_003740 [Coniothyrium glycines]